MNIDIIQISDLLYTQALELRYQLFFKEHNLPKSILNDRFESSSKHVAISQQDNLIAYGRLSELDNKTFQISQMVVAPLWQSQGYGTKILLELMKIAKSKGAKIITLNARTSAIDLYQKQGFQQQGSVYKSSTTTVPHIKMAYYLY